MGAQGPRPAKSRTPSGLADYRLARPVFASPCDGLGAKRGFKILQSWQLGAHPLGALPHASGHPPHRLRAVEQSGVQAGSLVEDHLLSGFAWRLRAQRRGAMPSALIGDRHVFALRLPTGILGELRRPVDRRADQVAAVVIVNLAALDPRMELPAQLGDIARAQGGRMVENCRACERRAVAVAELDGQLVALAVGELIAPERPRPLRGDV